MLTILIVILLGLALVSTVGYHVFDLDSEIKYRTENTEEKQPPTFVTGIGKIKHYDDN